MTMSNFKIQLDLYKVANFLCSYDDAKFVKSNPDLARRFKEFYEGKSFAFNVNRSVRIILHLRTVMPLFKEDRGAFVCSYPVVLITFKARVVYCAKPYRVFVQPMSHEESMKKLLDDMFEHYKSSGKGFNKLEPGQICAVHSEDDNWYRARVVSKDSNGSQVEVFYIDYGNTETVKLEDIKMLDDKFYSNASGYAIEINLPLGKNSNENILMASVTELLEEQVVTVKPIEVRSNHLLADILLENNQNIVDALQMFKLIPGRDLDYMRKQLEKDLTTDDDDDKRIKENSKPAAAAASPKSKTPPQNKPEVKKVIDPVVEVAPKPAQQTPTPTPAPTPEPPIASPEPVVLPEPQPEPIVSAVPTPPPAVVEEEPQEDRYKGMETAVLSHYYNPAHFFVHPIDILDSLQKLQENLQIISSYLPQLSNAVNGGDCISLNSVDKLWYRARIIDAELMVIQFVDFGNVDCVSDMTDLKESMGSHVIPFCQPCALPIAPKGTSDWVDAANDIFNDSFSKILRYKYLTHGDYQTPSYVELYIDDVDVAKKLIADGYAKPLEYVESDCSCYISHVNGICEFYIQLERDWKALESMEMYLRDAEQQLKPLELFEKGEIVAALFEEDELWYRAELLRQLNETQYEVLLIDYGNTSITTKCLVLSEEIAKLPKLSKKCSLQLPESYTQWSKEAEAKFLELTGDGELVFTTKLVKPAQDHVVIDLLLDEVNIIDQLLALARKQPSK